jgi:twitching motility protein PilT
MTMSPAFSPTLDDILNAAVASLASDIHLTADHAPLVRVEGSLQPIAGIPNPISEQWIVANLIEPILSQQQRDALIQQGELDLSYSHAVAGRFRVNVFRERGRYAATLRLIPTNTLSLQDLGLPPVVTELAHKTRGLVLVTGPTGSGKSTTLASIVDLINRSHPAHIITIEDPIEFVHTNHAALVHQREVGSDTASFHEALRRALRQDPDVLLIGELRDAVSMEAALLAAETGHLVLATLHTQGAAKSINRLVGAFPDSNQAQVRRQLGDTLLGIVSQMLLPRASGPGRVVATEVLINTSGVANLIREGEVAQLYSAIQAGAASGMHTLDQDLKRLVTDGHITKSDAMRVAADPRSFEDMYAPVPSVDFEDWQVQTPQSPERRS